MAETESLDAKQGTPQFVVVCGLPGVGKTTVAEAVAERLDGRVIRTDVVRKDILDDPDYTEEESRMVYRELFERASEVVADGRSVVLDGTFKDAADRERAVELAESLDAPFRLVKVECDEAVVRDRIAEREDDASDADFEIHAMYRERFDAISTDHTTVDNSESVAETRRQVTERF